MTPLDFAVVAIAVAVGSALQGSVGFGLGLVASPALAFVDPFLVPAPLLLCALSLTILLALREHESIQFADLKWSLAGRFPGVLAGAAALAVVSAERVGIVFGVLVLLAATMSAVGPRVSVSPRTLLGAGFVSGFMGTTISIGGPPIALLYQNHAGNRLRATMSGYFTVGTAMSLVALGVIGRFGTRELLWGLALLPAMLVGFFASRRLAIVLDRGRTRIAVIFVSMTTAIAILIKYAL